jgi:RNA recognition motif-containing protein
MLEEPSRESPGATKNLRAGRLFRNNLSKYLKWRLNMRIYVGNLSYNVTEDELKQQFGVYGEVTSASIPIDRDSGRPKGFGFLDMPKQAEAEAAIQALNGKMYKDRALTVNEARPRTQTGNGGDGGRGGDRRPRRY